MTLTKDRLRSIFFFCRPSAPVYFNEPVMYSARTRVPWRRYLVGCLPRWLGKPFMTLHVSERIVEIPFVYANLRVPPRSTVVDLGCVESKLSLELANLGFKVLAVDLRAYPFQHPNLKVLKGDFATLPLESDSVDALIAVSTLEHIGLESYANARRTNSDQAVVEKVRRILKPNGQFILTVPYGIKSQTEWYRVYDRSALDQLLEGFEIAKAEFYRRTGRSTWERTNEAGAAEVASPIETNCVALLSAVAKKVLTSSSTQA